MKIIVLTICLLFILPKCSQDEYEVLKIVLNRVEFNSDKHILQCEKGNFVFAKENYQYEKEEIPLETLNELEKVSLKTHKKHTKRWCTSCISLSKWKKKHTHTNNYI